MDNQMRFKERVRNTIISEASQYKRYFVNYEYLLCSSAFTKKPYYIVSAHEDNYKHLTGVHSSLSADSFFDKALNGTLDEDDFDFFYRNQPTSQVRGSVRRKVQVLPNMYNLFSADAYVEEDFYKNGIKCSFAAGKSTCTIVFSDSDPVKPMSLRKGNELNILKARPLDLVLRRSTEETKFGDIILGDTKDLSKYFDAVRTLLSNYLISLVIHSKNNS